MKTNRNPREKRNPEAAPKPSIVERFMHSIDPELKRAVRKKMEIAVQIEEAMLAKGWTQKQFALRLGRSESEISKWLSGKQNFTLESLCMIEEALDCDIFQVPTASQGVSERTREHVAAMQREAALWNTPIHIGRVAQSGLSPHAISIDHFSLQPLSNYERHPK